MEPGSFFTRREWSSHMATSAVFTFFSADDDAGVCRVLFIVTRVVVERKEEGK